MFNKTICRKTVVFGPNWAKYGHTKMITLYKRLLINELYLTSGDYFNLHRGIEEIRRRPEKRRNFRQNFLLTPLWRPRGPGLPGHTQKLIYELGQKMPKRKNKERKYSNG